MFLLTAIFNAACLDDVLTDLYNSNIEGVTISHVSGKGDRGYILDSGKTRLYKNVRIDIVVSSIEFKELAKEAIRSNIRDFHTGSGKMWVTPVLEVERIRTGEKDKAALAHSELTKSKNSDESSFSAINSSAS